MQVTNLKITLTDGSVGKFDKAKLTFSKDGKWIIVIVGIGTGGKCYGYSTANTKSFSFDGANFSL